MEANLFTNEELEELLNQISPGESLKSFPICPKCKVFTKRVIFRQKFPQKTFIEVVNERDVRTYTGVFIKDQCVFLKCKTVYIE